MHTLLKRKHIATFIIQCLFKDLNNSICEFGAHHLKATLQRQTTKHADWVNNRACEAERLND